MQRPPLLPFVLLLLAGSSAALAQNPSPPAAEASALVARLDGRESDARAALQDAFRATHDDLVRRRARLTVDGFLELDSALREQQARFAADPRCLPTIDRMKPAVALYVDACHAARQECWDAMEALMSAMIDRRQIDDAHAVRELRMRRSNEPFDPAGRTAARQAAGVAIPTTARRATDALMSAASPIDLGDRSVAWQTSLRDLRDSIERDDAPAFFAQLVACLDVLDTPPASATAAVASSGDSSNALRQARSVLDGLLRDELGAELPGSLARPALESRDAIPTAAEPARSDTVRTAWSVGSEWISERDANHASRTWSVDAFNGDLLTLSHATSENEGREVLTFRMDARGGIELVEVRGAGGSADTAFRGCRGRGSITRERARFDVTAQRQEAPSNRWSAWRCKITLRSATVLDRLFVGAKVAGWRTEPKPSRSEPVATMTGSVTRFDSRWLVIRAAEQWRTPRGLAHPVYDWRFERDGVDPESGAPRWAVRDGAAAAGSQHDNRSNWRGYVVFDGQRLEGRYGFDWGGMEARGEVAGTKDLTHPLRLELVDATRPGAGR